MINLQKYQIRKYAKFTLWILLSCLLSVFAHASEENKFSDTFDAQIKHWTLTADQAEKLIENKNATTWTLEIIRDSLSDQRQEAFDLTQDNNVRIETLEAQLRALGPVPSEGFSESETVAARRGELNLEIDTAKAPILAASEALERANVLIKRIDRILLEQRAQSLITQYSSPLALDRLPNSLSEMGEQFKMTVRDVKERAEIPLVKEYVEQKLPLIIFLLTCSILILFFILPFTLKKIAHMEQGASKNPFVNFFPAYQSLSRLFLLSLGIAPFVFALILIDQQLFPKYEMGNLLSSMSIDVIVSIWLGYTIFAPQNNKYRLVQINKTQSINGYKIAILFGCVSALEILVSTLDEQSKLTDISITFLSAPLFLAASFLLWGLAGVLLSKPQKLDVETAGNIETPLNENAEFIQAFRKYFSYLLYVSSIAISFAALIGYIKLSREIFNSTAETLGVLGIALVLYRALVILLDRPGKAESDPKAKSQTLIPILVFILLALIIVPVLSLIWGARVTDIADIWHVLNEGWQVGDVRISIGNILMLIIIFMIGFFATRVTQRILKISILPRTKMDQGASNALVTGVGYLGIFLACMAALTIAGVNLASLAILAGALSLGIGFGMQTIVSNFVSGIILLIERPIKLGDWIEVSQFSGYVRKISVRSTRIETFDKHDVIVPNADLIAGTVMNMTLTNKNGRIIVPVGVAYGCDIEKVEEIMYAAATNHKEILKTPAAAVLFIQMGDSALQFELRCFIRKVDMIMAVKSDLLKEIYINLQKAGIEIPFPQRDVHLYLPDDEKKSSIQNILNPKQA